MKTMLQIGPAARGAAFLAIVASLATTAPSVQASAVKSAPAASEPVPLEKDMDYREARAALVKQGWKPVVTGFKDQDEGLKKLYSAPKELLGLGWKEIEYCEGADHQYCFFNFSKNHHCLKVITQYEYIKERRQFPLVMSWRRQCPKNDDYD